MKRDKRERSDCSENDVQVVGLYLKGVPVKEIAETLNISYSAIYSALRRCGVEPNRKKRHRNVKRLTPEELEEIVKLYRSGESIYMIARRLGRAPSTIYYALKRLGLRA